MSDNCSLGLQALPPLVHASSVLLEPIRLDQVVCRDEGCLCVCDINLTPASMCATVTHCVVEPPSLPTLQVCLRLSVQQCSSCAGLPSLLLVWCAMDWQWISKRRIQCVFAGWNQARLLCFCDDDLAGAGANASGACMLCGAGTYQTGSGQIQQLSISFCESSSDDCAVHSGSRLTNHTMEHCCSCESSVIST